METGADEVELARAIWGQSVVRSGGSYGDLEGIDILISVGVEANDVDLEFARRDGRWIATGALETVLSYLAGPEDLPRSGVA